MRPVLLVILLFLASGALADPPQQTVTIPIPRGAIPPPPINAAEVERYFPPGIITADLCEIGADPRYLVLLAKVQTAIQKDPVWWKGLIDKAAGAQVAFDPKMGITQAEYDEMITLAKSIKLKKSGTTTLEFKRTATGEIRLNAGKGAEPLSGLTLSADRTRVATGFGTLASRHDVHQLDRSAPSGLWSGVEWEAAAPDSTSGDGSVARLAIGRISGSSRGILYLDIREAKTGTSSGSSRIITYPLAEH